MDKRGREAKETLSELVRRIRREKSFSLMQVENNAGGTITNGHVNRIENGHIENLTADKIQALADGLQVSPLMICEALFGVISPDDSMSEELLLHFKQMSEDSRSYLMLIARAFRNYKIEYVTEAPISNAYRKPIRQTSSKIARK